MNLQIQSVAGFGLLALLASCGSDDNDGGGGGGSPAPVEVEFGVPTTIAQEDASFLEVDVVLNKPSSGLLIVDFFVSGDAQQSLDYHILTGTPLKIPSGVVSTKILVQVFEDTLGEKDEAVDFTLLTPLGGVLGDNTTHRLTITDEDAQSVAEAEPNNDVANSNVIGGIQEELSYIVSGNISAAFEEYDIFQLTATDDSDVFIQLIPANYVSQVRFHVLDAAGTIIFSYAGAAGDTITTEYEAVSGEVFNVAVWVEAADTDYQLDLVGLPSTLTANGGPGTETSELTQMGRSFGSDLDGFRAWLDAKLQSEAQDNLVTDQVILTVVTED
ncbi:hypothetical protein CMO84_00495 [Candidatus Woesearchaeota archaeon]|nr:hypothetical protein [Candidatus Woesearchaeota archaeon]MDP6739490.1 hypothetical protein [Planctomycetota bacterium]MDP6938423.1 hypothetical protein [Planctomycetota bacterium]